VGLPEQGVPNRGATRCACGNSSQREAIVIVLVLVVVLGLEVVGPEGQILEADYEDEDDDEDEVARGRVISQLDIGASRVYKG
jgi:hypothetical protein